MIYTTPAAEAALIEYLALLDRIQHESRPLWMKDYWSSTDKMPDWFTAQHRCETACCVAGWQEEFVGEIATEFAQRITRAVWGRRAFIGGVFFGSYRDIDKPTIREQKEFLGCGGNDRDDRLTNAQTLARLNRCATWLLHRIRTYNAWDADRDKPRASRADHRPSVADAMA